MPWEIKKSDSQQRNEGGQQKKQAQPTHIVIDCEFLESKSTILLEQIRTIDKTRLSDYLGQLSHEDILQINKAMAVSLGMRGEWHE